MAKDDAFHKFIEDFKGRTEGIRLSKIIADERLREKRLIEMGFVDEDDNRLKHWKDKILSLRENEKRLARIYLDFEAFDLPYAYEDKHEVINLYESLMDSIGLAQKTNVAAQLIQEARESASPEGRDLQKDEQKRLLEMFHQGRKQALPPELA